MKRVVVVLMMIAALACRREEKQAEAPGYAKPGAAKTSAPQTTTAPAGSEVGSRMPEYAAMWLDGSKFELESRRDKVVLLNVWATWCAPCRLEIPELQKLHNEYAPKGFEVVGVSLDESGVESVRDFVKEYKMTYPVVLDAEGKLANILQTTMLPTSVIIDRSGKIVWKHIGLIQPNDEELAKAIEAAL